MALQEDKTMLQGCFSSWLAQRNDGAFGYKAGGDFYTVIRVRKNDDFDYLYCQRQYNGNSIERGDKFEYAGAYCKRDGRLYDRQYCIKEISADDDASGKENLMAVLKQAVRETVEAAINNDRRNLTVTEIPEGRLLEQLDYARMHEAMGVARKLYLDNDGSEQPVSEFRCRYSPDRWTEDSLLAYILDPAAYAAEQTARHLADNQHVMLYDFLLADTVAAEYQKLLDNPLNPIHRMKRIMQAVNASSAKTVTVTICKDDIDFTFKIEADYLRRDCFGVYNDWNIVAADRREYKKLFGNNASFKPEDILRIEYARTVLYQAEAAE